VEPNEERRFRAGDRVEDRCRVCKDARRHTVLAADAAGRPLRVICDHCGSQHNYRGGAAFADTSASSAGRAAARDPVPLVGERETGDQMAMSSDELTASEASLERLLRRVLREEAGLTPVAPAERWRGGQLVLRPGREGVQEKSWPIETFFHKVVMLRNRLRSLEQQVNASELSDDAKLKLQSYVTACYGSLTSFNVLFANDEDRFKGRSD
jgi:hypothetical protein